METFDNAGTSLGPELPFDNIGTTNRYVQMSENAAGWIATYEDSQHGTTPGATFISSFVAGGIPTYASFGDPTVVSAPGALSRDGFLLVPLTQNFSVSDHDVHAQILLLTCPLQGCAKVLCFRDTRQIDSIISLFFYWLIHRDLLVHGRAPLPET